MTDPKKPTDLQALLDAIFSINAGPSTIAALISDRGLDPVAVRKAAEAEHARCKKEFETDTSITVELVEGINAIIEATSLPEEPDPEPVEAVDPEPVATEKKPDPPTDSDEKVGNETDDQATADPIEPTEVLEPSAANFRSRPGHTLDLKPNRLVKLSSELPAAADGYVALSHDGSKTFSNVEELNGEIVNRLSDIRSSRSEEGRTLFTHKLTDKKFHRTAGMSHTDVDSLINESVAHHAKFSSNGWCAPSVQRYEFCPIPNAWGLFGEAIPMVTSDRGGISWPVTPKLSDLWGTGIGCWTEAEEKERTDLKPCTEAGCTNFVDYRDRICSLCVTSSALSDRAFPELTAQIVQTHEVIYEWMINYNMLQLALEYAVAANGDLRWDTSGWGILQALKEKISVAIDMLAARTQLQPQGTTWNVALPYWAFGAIRSDLAKRVGADISMMSVGRQQIVEILSGGLRVRFWEQMPWQTALVEDAPVEDKVWLGSDNALEEGNYPSTMELLIWPQGAFVGVRDDFLNIRGRWDYGLQRDNKKLQIFAESAWNLIPRCYESLKITLDICTAGRSGNLFDFPCDNPTPEPVP